MFASSTAPAVAAVARAALTRGAPLTLRHLLTASSSIQPPRLYAPLVNTAPAPASRPKRRLKKIPITLDVPAPPTAEEAVSNILYNAPPSSRAPITRHILNCLVNNEPGVLSRISGVLAGRGFNIDSLVVARTDVPDLSRMTIVLNGQATVVEQARRQLEDLVPVWAVLDYTHARVVERELLMVKVSTIPHEHVVDDEEPVHDTHHHASDSHQPAIVNPLVAAGLQRQSITELARLFNARIVDVALDSMIIEMTAKPDRIDAFLQLLKPYGISEAARSGSMAMPRAPLDIDSAPRDEATEDVDLTSLPPG
ncbi:acetolactate synthase [Synchytrium endobioticum]|uniref:Acetolactate synthase n=1 Tax=Synchytrium endobioticum TaxID=286115 RepID=A0A507CXZ2_9FUNG|nr:acetolactate synthase [Synchytrium endobioticum]